MRPCPDAVRAFSEALEFQEIEHHMEEYDGLCLACGEWSYGEVEPDARNYLCESCGKRAVYGTEECVLMMVG
jgi:hypothetical protein